ncbi:TetR/AcrR family transcriptional regulator [Pseudonocardia oroxyli]|uniref:TetR/AcrR family transcriptional regulator n=1 Tax=Pseudonocardia oroxyli TaxID=366584 RepID=UPI001FDF30F9|nr:TetR/AcrR family transcriptional regulator [Pseudonocardia oroxyli]
MSSPRSAPRTARARVRAQLTAEIVEVARAHLATAGAAQLSLRAVARELGMVSSAVYRYFPSRDDLLTALIIEGYDALGAAVEAAGGDSLLQRWLAACAAAREWALAHPHEYALLYGSPVPGYQAPQDTIAPAGRVALVLAGIVRDGIAAGEIAVPEESAPVSREMLDAVDLPEGLGGRLVQAWSSLFGAISFELFGHTHNVVEDHEQHFTQVATRLAAGVGITPPITPPSL